MRQEGDALRRRQEICGARPVELCEPLGAVVEVSSGGLAVTLRGAKTGAVSGQELRHWQIGKVPAELSKVLASLHATTFSNGSRLKVNPPEVHALRRAVAAAARRLGLRRL